MPIDAIDLTRRLVNIESISYHEGAVGAFLADFLAAQGYAVERMAVEQPDLARTPGGGARTRASTSMPRCPASRPTWFSPPTWTRCRRSSAARRTTSFSTAAALATPREFSPRRSLPRTVCAKRASRWACSSSLARNATRPARRWPTAIRAARASSSTASPPTTASPLPPRARCAWNFAPTGAWRTPPTRNWASRRSTSWWRRCTTCWPCRCRSSPRSARQR